MEGEIYRGSPVEAVFTSDGSHAFVSNYRMYGPGYDPAAGNDACTKDDGQRSFVYRIDTETLTVDRAHGAGPVPKFMAVTPDDRLLLVSNWCGYDVSVIDLESHQTLAEIEVGRHPRGIAVTSERPRSMDISDDGTALYVVNYGSDTFTKLRASDLAVLQTLDTAARHRWTTRP